MTDGPRWHKIMLMVGALLGIPAAIATILVLFVGDNILGVGGPPAPSARESSPSQSASTASADNHRLSDLPVAVLWTGNGEKIEVIWHPMTYEDLDSYGVTIYGLRPAESETPVIVKAGEGTKTRVIVSPVADTVAYYKLFPDTKAPNVGVGETWRVCVTAQKTPGPDGEVREIEGSEICSEEFEVPP